MHYREMPITLFILELTQLLYNIVYVPVKKLSKCLLFNTFMIVILYSVIVRIPGQLFCVVLQAIMTNPFIDKGTVVQSRTT